MFLEGRYSDLFSVEFLVYVTVLRQQGLIYLTYEEMTDDPIKTPGTSSGNMRRPSPFSVGVAQLNS